MATLEHTETGRPHVCGSRCVIGRADRSELVIDDIGVSGEHALVFWNGLVWSLRDLGSRNGTWVGDRRVVIGYDHALAAGEVVRFGVHEQRWMVVDVDPPDEEAPAPVLEPTRDAERRIAFDQLELRIRVSTDQEFFEIDLVGPAEQLRLAPRAFHDLLVVLATARLDDQARVAPAEAGWVYTDTLARQLGRGRQRVNLDVFRARQQLQEAGVDDAVRLFERRPTTSQIRLGTDRIRIESLSGE